MAEKINGQGFRPVDAGSARRSEKSGHASSQSGRAVSETTADKVNIERAELLVSRLSEVLDVVPVVDIERVRAVRDAIASGNYQVDPGAVADKILQFERELNL